MGVCVLGCLGVGVLVCACVVCLSLCLCLCPRVCVCEIPLLYPVPFWWPTLKFRGIFEESKSLSLKQNGSLRQWRFCGVKNAFEVHDTFP